MTRHGMNDDQMHTIAVQAARSMIARGERPLYRLEAEVDAGGLSAWRIPTLPGLAITAPHRRELDRAARQAIASLLGVPVDAFDVEVGI